MRKSTVRPWPSVSRPSSSTCSRTSKTSGCAFSTSSSSTTRVRPAADGLGELAALLVADVAGRRADQPRDRVLLAVLAHVDADHRPLVVEQEVRERLGQLGLADAGRAEEQERAGRPVGVADAGPRAAYGVGHRARRRRAGRSAGAPSTSSMRSSFSVSPSSSRPAGMPVQAATTSATSSGPTSSLTIGVLPGDVGAASAACAVASSRLDAAGSRP